MIGRCYCVPLRSWSVGPNSPFVLVCGILYSARLNVPEGFVELGITRFFLIVQRKYSATHYRQVQHNKRVRRHVKLIVLP